MDKEKADKLILRSMDVDMADSMDTVFQLPATTFIGGKVRKRSLKNIDFYRRIDIEYLLKSQLNLHCQLIGKGITTS